MTFTISGETFNGFDLDLLSPEELRELFAATEKRLRSLPLEHDVIALYSHEIVINSSQGHSYRLGLSQLLTSGVGESTRRVNEVLGTAMTQKELGDIWDLYRSG